ncbi:MAG: hypothetical protein H8E98_03890 [Bacteroidetes bacterium]|nr:hypothetical protein [Bacteroidota bacterium]
MKKKLRKNLIKENKIPLCEGVYDPGILKAVILSGSAGSGKSYVAKSIFGIPDLPKFKSSLSSIGLKVVNSDSAFEVFLKKRGVDPKNLGKMTDKVFNYYTSRSPDTPKSKAQNIRDKLYNIYKDGRLGLIIDTTGSKLSSVIKKKKELEELGYDVYLLFVNTSLKVGMARNKKRTRVLPDKAVKQNYEEVQANISKYKSVFGNRFFEIDNNEDKPPIQATQSKILRIVQAPVKNPIGKKWIETALKLKSLK